MGAVSGRDRLRRVLLVLGVIVTVFDEQTVRQGAPG